MSRSAIETGFIGSSPARRVEKVSLRAPLRWISAGVRDFVQMPVFSLTCGAVIGLLGYGAVKLSSLPVVSNLGYLAVVAVCATFVAGALCAASRQLRRDEGAEVKSALRRLWQSKVHVAMLSVMVVALTLAWFRLSVLMLVVSSSSSVAPSDSIFDLLIASNSGIVVGILTVFALLTAVFLFSVSAIALPLVIDGDEDFLNAMITSFQAMSQNPIAMLLWANVVALLTIWISATWLPGFVVISPILGYATWHGYKALIKT